MEVVAAVSVASELIEGVGPTVVVGVGATAEVAVGEARAT